MTLLFSASTSFVANGYDEEYTGGGEGVTYKPESPVWEGQPSFPPASSDNFVWQGHNPADNGWRAEEGSMDHATLIHWSNRGLTPPFAGGHIFEISPVDSKMIIIAKDFTGDAGSWLVVDWTVEFNDYPPPYMDVVFAYTEGENGVTTTLFSSIVTDGSSDWKQSWTYLEKSGEFTLYIGAMNALDEEYAPKLLIGGINVITFGGEKGLAELSAAPVPVPAAMWLLASAVGGLATIRRRKTA